MKKHRRKSAAIIAVICALLIAAALLFLPDKQPERETAGANAADETASAAAHSSTEAENMAGQLETVSYTINYDGETYDKEAYVYVPASYDGAEPMNILYLMHGSGGSGESLAESLQPLFDSWISSGEMEPMLVVFPTYYPDSSFVTADYSEDYPLNHFFAESEVTELMRAAEGKLRTYAESTDDAGFRNSRMHRAFGGYSMGGVTTWDVLAYQASYFGYYMPMAGDCWLDRVTEASSDSDTADLLMQGLEEGGYTSEEFRIIAMVGGSDGTKSAMKPQIEALRENHADLITDDNLLYWENEGGGHNLASLETEVRHGLPYLWTAE